MKEPTFTCDAQALAKTLRDVSGLNQAREMIPILKNVLVEVKDGIAKFTGTNMDCFVTRTMTVESDQDGATTIELDKFRDIAKTFPAGAQAKIVCEKGWATMTCARSRVRLSTLSTKDFPPLVFGDVASELTVSAPFIRALDKVRHAAASQEARYWMAGVALQSEDGVLQLVATDADRFARHSAEAGDVQSVIIPNAGVERILSLTDGSDDIMMALNERMIRWTFGATTITHKLIDGTFPDYQKIMRAQSPATIAFDADHLSNALSRIAILSSDKERTALLAFELGKLTVSSRSAGAQGEDEIPCDYSGEAFHVAIRAQFLRDALASLDADDVIFGMIPGERAPIMLTAEAKPDAICILMPLIS